LAQKRHSEDVPQLRESVLAGQVTEIGELRAVQDPAQKLHGLRDGIPTAAKKVPDLLRGVRARKTSGRRSKARRSLLGNTGKARVPSVSQDVPAAVFGRQGIENVRQGMRHRVF
jgi:hypothetical protein